MRRHLRHWFTRTILLAALVSGLVSVRVAHVNAACTDSGFGKVTNLSVTIDSANAGAGYKVWSRMQGPSANSTYLLEDTMTGTCYTVGGAGVSSTVWNWTDRLDGQSKTISLAAGTHNLILYGTANDVLLDRIIFTKSTSGACAPPVNTGDTCVDEPAPDSTDPTVSITSPANNATITSGSATLQASASDNSGSVSKVEYYQGTTKIGESTTSPYSVTWNTSALSGGYSLTAKAYDAAGNIGSTTSATSVTVNNGKPNLKITALSISPTTIGQSATITATVQNVGAVATTAGVVNTVSFSMGSTVLTPATNNATLAVNGTRQFTTTWTAAAGTFNLSAKVDNLNTIAETDENDNTNQISVTVASPDTTKPAVSITAPAPNATNLNGSVNITATATDAGGSGMQKVEFYVDDVLQGQVTSGSSATHTYAWNTSTFTNAGHKIGVRAYDKAGNFSDIVSINVSVTNVVPSAPARGDTSAEGTPGYGIVNYNDLVIVLASYEKGAGKTRAQGNVDNTDGLNVVNYRDLTAVLSGWTK